MYLTETLAPKVNEDGGILPGVPNLVIKSQRELEAREGIKCEREEG